jgi:hypothetical protein
MGTCLPSVYLMQYTVTVRMCRVSEACHAALCSMLCSGCFAMWLAGCQWHDRDSHTDCEPPAALCCAGVHAKAACLLCHTLCPAAC